MTPHKQNADTIPDLSAAIAVAAPVGKIKAGVIAAGSFSGVVKEASVTFATPFADANYSLDFGVQTDLNTVSFFTSITSKTAAGFTVSLTVGVVTNLVSVTWTAVKHGEY